MLFIHSFISFPLGVQSHSLPSLGMSLFLAHSPPSSLHSHAHVTMPIPDTTNDLPTPFPLLQDPAFQMPFQLFQNTSERVRRPATASILDSPSSFVLPTPPVPSNQQDPLVCSPPSPADPQPTFSQPTPPARTDADVSDYTHRCDVMSGMPLSAFPFADPD